MESVMFWIVLGFLSGSIPFSYWLGCLLLKTDIRRYGDGNPGATNVFRAGSWPVGLLVGLLDILKGYLPVLLARSHDISGWGLVPVAIAPVLGHAFSPFLGFHGGKALAATWGVWLALIGPLVFPVYAAFTLPMLALQVEHAWAAFAGMFSLLGYTLFLDRSRWLIAIAVLNLMTVMWTHRKELLRRFQLRPWASQLLSRREV
ncbi:MAG: glycerol-3-phosphate acyltransferase [Chloroflexota bacterium]